MEINVLNRFELLFWNFAIRILSHSGKLRAFVQGAIRLVRGQNIASLGAVILASGMAGLASGFVLYFVVFTTQVR